MKKAVSILMTAMMAFGAAACCQAEDASAETVEITCLNGAGEKTEMAVPYDPERIAILDMAALDILDNLDLGDRVVGSASTSLDYLQSYVENEEIVNLGTIKEADLEAVMACEPDIIFIGGRLSASYDALSEIAPVVYLSTDTEIGLLESTRQNAQTIASIFGKEAEIEEKFAGFDERIATLHEFAEGKTAVIGMCTSGSFNVIGNGGRCSLIGVEVGFENLCADVAESSGGGRGGNGGQGGGRENAGAQEGAAEAAGEAQEGTTEAATEAQENATEAETEVQEGTTEAATEAAAQGNGGAAESAHGNEVSFELIVSLNPDYIFVMDRDAAIGTNGAQLAQEIMENELVMGTDAYKNGNLVILEHPAVWYTAEGGVTAFDVMLSDLESALLN